MTYCVGVKLDAGQMQLLAHSARRAKEELFANPKLATAPVTVLGRGSRVIGGTIQDELTRAEVEQVLVDGFFPQVPLDAVSVSCLEPHADSAARIFEDIVERVDATPDERVEAGYNLGKVLSRNDRDKAQVVWWNDVVVGLLYEKEGRLDEAKRAWTLWIDSGLPDEEIARDRLARFHLPAAKS